MSHIHFVTNAEAGKRVAQLGEDPTHIHVTGSPGLDAILTAPALSREEFFFELQLTPTSRCLLVTFHPVTRERDSLAQAGELVAALAGVPDDTAIIVTGSNADPEGDTVDALMQDFAKSRSNARYVASLGIGRYANALRHVDAVVGNSSSGLYEAPSFGVPTVNIGSRQDGRIRASSVMDCAPQRAEITAAIERAFAIGRQPTVNPYGDGRAGERIVAVLKSIGDPSTLIRKRFRDLDS
jgi:UDP-hydrolysing UDP-N-acetyl-D-glucosamine 2-epimerase